MKPGTALSLPFEPSAVGNVVPGASFPQHFYPFITFWDFT